MALVKLIAAAAAAVIVLCAAGIVLSYRLFIRQISDDVARLVAGRAAVGHRRHRGHDRRSAMLAAGGCKVIVADRDQAGIDRVVAAIKATGGIASPAG